MAWTALTGAKKVIAAMAPDRPENFDLPRRSAADACLERKRKACPSIEGPARV